MTVDCEYVPSSIYSGTSQLGHHLGPKICDVKQRCRSEVYGGQIGVSRLS